MKVLVLFDYPSCTGGLATQGSLLYRGLQELGIDVFPVNFESAQEKEWYYRWFEPDVVLGVGYWGHPPHRNGGIVFCGKLQLRPASQFVRRR